MGSSALAVIRINMPGCPVLAAQNRQELQWILEIYRYVKPIRILEIGSLYGGTLWHWMHNSDVGTVIVSLDWNIYTNDVKVESIKEWRGRWPEWAQETGTVLRTIWGDSTLPETIAKAKRYAPYDFIFVDGGHLYHIVDADYKNYYPMLSHRGRMAFHDIAGGTARSQPVAQWWQDVIVPNHPNRLEMIEDKASGMFGIGVIDKS